MILIEEKSIWRKWYLPPTRHHIKKNFVYISQFHWQTYRYSSRIHLLSAYMYVIFLSCETHLNVNFTLLRIFFVIDFFCWYLLILHLSFICSIFTDAKFHPFYRNNFFLLSIWLCLLLLLHLLDIPLYILKIYFLWGYFYICYMISSYKQLYVMLKAIKKILMFNIFRYSVSWQIWRILVDC